MLAHAAFKAGLCPDHAAEWIVKRQDKDFANEQEAIEDALSCAGDVGCDFANADDPKCSQNRAARRALMRKRHA